MLPEIDYSCTCGKELPDRRHLAFHCETHPFEKTKPEPDSLQEGLCVPIVKLPKGRQMPMRKRAHPPLVAAFKQIVQQLTERGVAPNTYRVDTASDGGAEGLGYLRNGSMGIAIAAPILPIDHNELQQLELADRIRGLATSEMLQRRASNRARFAELRLRRRHSQEQDLESCIHFSGGLPFLETVDKSS